MPKRYSKAGTAADRSTPDEVTTSSQPIANRMCLLHNPQLLIKIFVFGLLLIVS